MFLDRFFRYAVHFYPRPPGGGRPFFRLILPPFLGNFYPRPPGGGRPGGFVDCFAQLFDFYPRPPGGGRLCTFTRRQYGRYFYPRPPGGGRPYCSNSSAPRAANFYPRPPGGGRRINAGKVVKQDKISIHALRVEGDVLYYVQSGAYSQFLSTPSGWRATTRCWRSSEIPPYFYPRPPGGGRRYPVRTSIR